MNECPIGLLAGSAAVRYGFAARAGLGREIVCQTVVADRLGGGPARQDEERVGEDGDEVAWAIGAGRVEGAARAFTLGAMNGEVVCGRGGSRSHVVCVCTSTWGFWIVGVYS